MNRIDCFSFILRILIFIVSFYYMVDYLYICNVDTRIGSSVVIIAIILITSLYYPLRGKYVKTCRHCSSSYATNLIDKPVR